MAETDVLERPGEAEQDGRSGFSHADALTAELAQNPAVVPTEASPGNLDMAEIEAQVNASSALPEVEAVMDPVELARTEELIKKVGVDSATRENNRWNDMVEARRRSEKAERERDEEYGMQYKASLAAELLGQLKGDPISETTRMYLSEGGSLHKLLTDLREYDTNEGKTGREKVQAVDKELSDSRRQLMEASLKKKGLLHREEKLEAKRTAEERYLKAFATKLEQLSSVPKGDKEAALDVGYISQILDKMGFDSENLTLEELAGNQLHVLTDLLCREQLMRQQVAEEVGNKGVNKLLKFVKNSKLVHGVVAAGVFGVSAVSLAHGLPEAGQHAVEMAERGMGVMAAYITSRELLEGSVESFEGIGARRKQKKAEETLAGDQQLADLTLRTAYNQVETMPDDRKGTADKAENLARFETIQSDYADLRTAPGGKPFTAEMVLEYCSRLYIDNKDKLDQLAATPDQQGRKDAYQEIARMILATDVEQMQHTINRGRVQRTIYRGLSVAGAVVASNIMTKISESRELSSGVPNLLNTELHPRQI